MNRTCRVQNLSKYNLRTKYRPLRFAKLSKQAFLLSLMYFLVNFNGLYFLCYPITAIQNLLLQKDERENHCELILKRINTLCIRYKHEEKKIREIIGRRKRKSLNHTCIQFARLFTKISRKKDITKQMSKFSIHYFLFCVSFEQHQVRENVT